MPLSTIYWTNMGLKVKQVETENPHALNATSDATVAFSAAPQYHTGGVSAFTRQNALTTNKTSKYVIKSISARFETAQPSIAQLSTRTLTGGIATTLISDSSVINKAPTLALQTALHAPTSVSDFSRNKHLKTKPSLAASPDTTAKNAHLTPKAISNQQKSMFEIFLETPAKLGGIAAVAGLLLGVPLSVVLYSVIGKRCTASSSVVVPR